MKNTDLRDCQDNMIFESDSLKNKSNGDTYFVRFGYYMVDDVEVYGFYLVSQDYYTVHHMPKHDCNGMLKLLNTSRCDPFCDI